MNDRRATTPRSVAVLVTLLTLGLTAFPLAGEPAAPPAWRTQAAAALPETGEIHLALYNDGERDGFMRLGWRKAGDAIELYDRTMMPSGEVYESMRAELSATDLAPRSVEILFYQGPAILRIDAGFDGARVTGSRTVEQPQQGSRSQPLDLDAPNVLFRGTSFILPLVLPDAGEPVTYDWYAALANAVGSVSLTAVDGGTIETPAGSFDTIRYELRGGSPENDIYVTRGPERRVVRIDVLGMPMQFLALPQHGER